ncbi:hypothetical protein RRG08_052622 [Elysia crispata]|uniref:Uncharacterized protein n=1 Tax=Elysia crispata TaxID=231223 RepID=A0AAE1DXU9_9GAST|nr:hypothetical protein RRG08_052622 [Elysia crispata]
MAMRVLLSVPPPGADSLQGPQIYYHKHGGVSGHRATVRVYNSDSLSSGFLNHSSMLSHRQLIYVVIVMIAGSAQQCRSAGQLVT